MSDANAPDQTTTETAAYERGPSQFITGNIRRHLRFGRGGVPFLKNIPVAPGVRLSAEQGRLETTCLGNPVHDGTVRFSWNSSQEVSQETFRDAVARIHQSLRAEERAWISGLVPVFDNRSAERLRLISPVLADGVPCLCTYAIYQPNSEPSDEKSTWRRAVTFPIDAIVAQSSRTDPRPFASTPPRGHGNQRITGLSLQATKVHTGDGNEVNTYVPNGYLIAIPPVVDRRTDEKGNVTVTVNQPGHLLLIPEFEDGSVGQIDMVANFLTAFEEVTSVFAAIAARGAAFDDEPVPAEILEAKDDVDEAQVEFENARATLNAAFEKLRKLRGTREQQRLDWTELAPYIAAALNRDVNELLNEGAGDQPAPDEADEQPGGEDEVAPPDGDDASSEEAETAPPV